MNISVAGRWVWITGASSGIGAALAREAASRGARVLLSGRDGERLRSVAASCEGLSARGGHSHGILPFDLLDRAARAAAVQKALALTGGLALLVLNAGVSQRARFEDLDPAAFERIMELDFFAPVDLVRRILPSFHADSPSGIVLVSSLAGLIPAPWRSAYVAAKHALSGFGGVLRGEVAGRNIAVTIAYPGYVRTGIAMAALGADGRSRGKEDHRIAAGADPEAVAKTIMAAALAGKAELRVAFTFESRLALFRFRHLLSLDTWLGIGGAKQRRRKMTTLSGNLEGEGQ